MNISSNNRLIRAFYWFTTIALYLQLIVAAITLITLLFTMADEGELLSAWDIETPAAVDTYTINVSHADSAQVIVFGGAIHFTASGIGYFTLKIIDSVFVFTVFILITVLLRTMLRSLEQGQPFTYKNVNRLRKMALLAAVITPYSFIKSLIYQTYITKHFTIEGYEFAGMFDFNLTNINKKIWLVSDVDIAPFIGGIILVILAEVFHEGVLIKRDNDSIV